MLFEASVAVSYFYAINVVHFLKQLIKADFVDKIATVFLGRNWI